MSDKLNNNYCDRTNFVITNHFISLTGQYGICVFSNETACEEWIFLRGQCDTTHPNFSVYCAENGGEINQENVDWGEVEGAPPATYDVCTSDGGQCTDYDYYALDSCSLTTSAPDVCTANGGTSRVMGTATGSDYTLCSFGNEYACELTRLLSGKCFKTNPSLISFCAEKGGSMSLGGVEPLEYEVCTVGELTCIEEDYYLNGSCDLTKDGEPNEVPPDNDTCSNATIISNDQLGILQSGSVKGATLDEWQMDPNCNFLQVPPGNGVWWAIKGIKGGTNLKVTCSFMDCMLLTTNSTLGECPSLFLCADAWVGGVSDDLTYHFTTEEEGIYYIYIAPEGPLAISEYNLLVEEVPDVKPTMAPTIIEIAPGPPTGSVPTNASIGNGSGTLFKFVLFAAIYFSV